MYSEARVFRKIILRGAPLGNSEEVEVADVWWLEDWTMRAKRSLPCD